MTMLDRLIKYAQDTLPGLIQMGVDAKPFIGEMLKVAAKSPITKADFDRIRAMEKPLRDELQQEEKE